MVVEGKTLPESDSTSWASLGSRQHSDGLLLHFLKWVFLLLSCDVATTREYKKQPLGNNITHNWLWDCISVNGPRLVQISHDARTSPLKQHIHTDWHISPLNSHSSSSSSSLDPICCHLALVWNRFTWRAQVRLHSSLPPSLPASSCPTGCGAAPPLWPLPPWWPLHPAPLAPAPLRPCGLNATSKHPIIWFCLPVPRTLPKATGNSWRVCGPVALGVELTGAPVFVSTFPHYHWIMVIINMALPGVGASLRLLLFLSLNIFQCLSGAAAVEAPQFYLLSFSSCPFTLNTYDLESVCSIQWFLLICLKNIIFIL